MLVAKVSGIPFGQFCQTLITDPIGAESTRVSTTINPDYPLIREGQKPAEHFYLQGCGGFTTTMIDLCKFGNLFLTENEVISEESKAEMRKMQGVTFLEEDTSSTRFGLGWDNVIYEDPEFDLGEHVQLKGGNSFQFSSKLFVIPKYNAVLTISQTDDCKLDEVKEILRLFALYMLEQKGVNIYRKYQLVPQELIDRFNGTYLLPGSICNTHFFGTDLTITIDNLEGKSKASYKNLKFDGTDFRDERGERYFFREAKQGKFFFSTFRVKVIPSMMKAEPHPALSDCWEKRVGKRYLAIDLSEQDMVSAEMMNGFTLGKLPNIEGVLVASFSSLPDRDVDSNFEGCVVPCDDNTARGFLMTPSNGSRDLIDPYFVEIDGVEHCYVASYLYRDEQALEDYAGQSFETLPESKYNCVYRLTSKLEKLPEVPKGRRLVVLNKQMAPIYDSQSTKEQEYKPVEEGYINFI